MALHEAGTYPEDHEKVCARTDKLVAQLPPSLGNTHLTLLTGSPARLVLQCQDCID